MQTGLDSRCNIF